MQDNKTAIQREREFYTKGPGKPLPKRHHIAHNRVRARIADILAAIGCTSDDLLLDLGIGTGLEVNTLKEYTSRIVGVDVSIEALEKTRRTYDIDCVAADIGALPFGPNQFDHVIIIGVLHHLVGHGQLPYFIEMAQGVLKPGGWLITIEPNLWFLNGPAFFLVQKLLPGRFFDLVPHERPLSPIHMQNLLKNAAFTDVKCEAATFAYNRFPYALSNALIRTETQLLKAPITRNLGWWNIVYGRKP